MVAARKHYRTNENYIAELNDKTGSIDLFAVKKVVETVENPAVEMTLQEARRVDPAAEIESEIRIPKSTDLLGRISAQTAKQVPAAQEGAVAPGKLQRQRPGPLRHQGGRQIKQESRGGDFARCSRARHAPF